ncbi:MAG: AAA family ATPase [bacterium]|nr:AAA family ATPase [bacterium]
MNAVTSDLGDVMVTIQEQIGHTEQLTSARLMSDGTLRFLAIAAALLDLSQQHSRNKDALEQTQMLVIEEIENGLHPSQGAVRLNQIKESTKSGVQTVATTHSPVVLNAMDGSDHSSVVVCSRNDSGWSTATRLTDFPNYFDVVGRASLGTAVVQDYLRPANGTTADNDSLIDVLGLR